MSKINILFYICQKIDKQPP